MTIYKTVSMSFPEFINLFPKEIACACYFVAGNLHTRGIAANKPASSYDNFSEQDVLKYVKLKLCSELNIRENTLFVFQAGNGHITVQGEG